MCQTEQLTRGLCTCVALKLEEEEVNVVSNEFV